MKLYLVLLCLIYSLPALTKGAIYNGNAVVNNRVIPGIFESSIKRSFKNSFAGGVDFWRFDLQEEEEEIEFYFLRLDTLLMDHKSGDNETKVIFHAGAGIVDELEDSPSVPAFLSGLEVAWKSSKYFTSATYLHYFTLDEVNLPNASAKFGLAPYKAEAKEEQPWVGLATIYTPDVLKELVLIPFIRFDHKNHYWELGASVEGNLYLTTWFEF